MNVRSAGGHAGPAFAKPKASARTSVPVAATTKVELTLPDEPREPVTDLGRCIIAIHGESGVGKTSLASCFDDPLFLFTEPGGTGLRIKERTPQNWAEFKSYISLIRRSDAHRTIVVDTVPKSYEMCHDHVCKEMGVDHPSEGKFGDVWKAITKEWEDQMLRLTKSGRGIIFVSHSELVEFQGRTGEAYNKIVPCSQKHVRAFIKRECDIKAYYGYFGPDRYLTIQGSDALEAGHRMKYQFHCADGGRVHSIEMFDHDNPEFCEDDGYQRLVAAFNNEQEGTGEPTTLKSVLGDTKVPMVTKGARPPRR